MRKRNLRAFTSVCDLGLTARAICSATMLTGLLAFATISVALGDQTSEDCLVRAKAVRALVVSDEPSHQVFKDRIGEAERLCRTGKTEEAEKILASVEQDLQAGGTNQ
jgi:hypothetical protein